MRYRFLRLQVDETYGSAIVRAVSIALRARESGENVCVGGVASASSGNALLALDNDPNTAWASAGEVAPWWQYEFPEVIDIRQFAWETGVDPTEGPHLVTLRVSMDGKVWTTVRRVRLLAWSGITQAHDVTPRTVVRGTERASGTKKHYVELWTDWECVGGVPLGEMRILDGTFTEQLDNTDQMSLTVLTDERLRMDKRRVTRIVHADTTVREYRINAREQGLDLSTIKLAGMSPVADLATSGVVADYANNVYPFYSLGGLFTLREFLTEIVMVNTIADGLGWLDIGVVDDTPALPLAAPKEGWTYLEWCRQLATKFLKEFRLTRNGADGYYLNFTRVGALAPLIEAHVGKNLIDIQNHDDDGESATALLTRGKEIEGGTYATIAENAWRIDSFDGNWARLSDPSGGDPPIVFDEQFGVAPTSQQAFLLKRDGTTVEVQDARASDAAVLVSSLAGLVVGEQVQFVKNAALDRLFELRTPHLQRLLRTTMLPDVSGERNLLQINSQFAQWTHNQLCVAWSPVNGARIRKGYRDDLGSEVWHAHLAVGVNQLTLLVTNGPPGQWVYTDDSIAIFDPPTTPALVTSAPVQLDASGAGTITVSYPIGGMGTQPRPITHPRYTIPAPPDPGCTSPYMLRIDGAQGSEPSGVPGSGGVPFGYNLSDRHALGAPVTVSYMPTLPNLRMTAAFSTNYGGGDDSVPAIMLRNAAGALWLKSAAANTGADVGQRDETLILDYPLTGNLTVQPVLFPGSGHNFYRWVMLTLHASAAAPLAPITLGANGNLLWQHSNYELLARRTDALSLTIKWQDLSLAAGYDLVREQLILGGMVYLPRLDLEVRVIGLIFGGVDPMQMQVMLDSRPPRLIRFLLENQKK